MNRHSDLDLLIIKEGGDALDLMGQIYERQYGVGAAVDAIVVSPAVIAPVLLAIAARRDDHFDLFGYEQFLQSVSIVAFIGNDSLTIGRGGQRLSLGEIMAFTTCQDAL